MLRGLPCFLIGILFLAGAPLVAAQQPEGAPPRTIQAVRVTVPLEIDGRLDEEF